MRVNPDGRIDLGAEAPELRVGCDEVEKVRESGHIGVGLGQAELLSSMFADAGKVAVAAALSL